MSDSCTTFQLSREGRKKAQWLSAFPVHPRGLLVHSHLKPAQIQVKPSTQLELLKGIIPKNVKET